MAKAKKEDAPAGAPTTSAGIAPSADQATGGGQENQGGSDATDANDQAPDGDKAGAQDQVKGDGAGQANQDQDQAGAAGEAAAATPTTQRYVVRAQYSSGEPEERRRLVVNDEKTGAELVGTAWAKVANVGDLDGQDKQMADWINEHYPNHRDPAAYWAD
jgi:hypothetical protein